MLTTADSTEFPRVPDSFPPGTRFFDVEDSPYVEIPGEGWFNAWLGFMRPFGKCMPGSVLRGGMTIDEGKFRRLVAASQNG